MDKPDDLMGGMPEPAWLQAEKERALILHEVRGGQFERRSRVVTLKACINKKLSDTESVTVDVIVEANTASEATEALDAVIKDMKADGQAEG